MRNLIILTLRTSSQSMCTANNVNFTCVLSTTSLFITTKTIQNQPKDTKECWSASNVKRLLPLTTVPFANKTFASTVSSKSTVKEPERIIKEILSGNLPLCILICKVTQPRRRVSNNPSYHKSSCHDFQFRSNPKRMLIQLISKRSNKLNNPNMRVIITRGMGNNPDNLHPSIAGWKRQGSPLCYRINIKIQPKSLSIRCRYPPSVCNQSL